MPTWPILLGFVVIIVAVCVYPFYKFLLSKAQMLGWLTILKQNEGEKENKDEQKKRK